MVSEWNVYDTSLSEGKRNNHMARTRTPEQVVTKHCFAGGRGEGRDSAFTIGVV